MSNGSANSDEGERIAQTQDAELARLRSALEDSRRELARAEGRIADMRASRSWRLTRPLRATYGVLESLRRLRIQSHPATDTADLGAHLSDDAIARSARHWTAARSVWPARAADNAAERTVKLIAFYLPQFHPIPENDLFWGPGFTEWAKVVRARPLFEGHYQPQLPTELGFYDLRVPEVLERQAELAQQFGVHGFCFHYYWFDGQKVLERPLEQLLARDTPDIPFCCCWANENWTRRWDGKEDDVLLRQGYDGAWAERFIRELLPVMADRRYIRVQDAALLLVYRVDLLPNPEQAAELWRQIARRELGLELHLAAVQSFDVDDPRSYGFDAAVEFPPHIFAPPAAHRSVRGLDLEFDGKLTDYDAIVRAALEKPLPEYPWYRGVMPSWDNTARRKTKAFLYLDSSPDAYGTWLRKVALQTACRRSAQAPLVFVNAWNEWAEGTHLEPDDRYGRSWLEATRAALIASERRVVEDDADPAPEAVPLRQQ